MSAEMAGDKGHSESTGSAPTVRSAESTTGGTPIGTRLRLKNGSVAEVTADPQDGGWLFIRYVECEDDPSKVGTDDMVFYLDVSGAV
jgi:hypothetical protein